MEIKDALSLLSDMLDLCAQLEDDTFNETCTGIYNDAISAKNTETVVDIARELMVFVGEQSWESEEQLREDVENIFNRLLEEYENF